MKYNKLTTLIMICLWLQSVRTAKNRKRQIINPTKMQTPSIHKKIDYDDVMTYTSGYQ